MDFEYSKGLSLLELLVSIFILSVMISISVPSYRYFVEKRKLDVLTYNLTNHLVLARNESLRRADYVAFCPAEVDQFSCLDKDGNWSKGWMAFLDSNNNNQRDSGENIISFYENNHSEITLHWNRLNTLLKFNRKGIITISGSFFICSVNKKELGRKLIIDLSGRSRMSNLVFNCE